MNGMLVSLFLPFSVLILFATAYFLSQKGRPGDLARLEAKVDMLLAHQGLTYDPAATLPPSVVEVVRRGDKIAAIRAYREATGAGLAEAKSFIESLKSPAEPLI